MLISSGRVVCVLYFSILCVELEKWAEYHWELSIGFFIYFVIFLYVSFFLSRLLPFVIDVPHTHRLHPCSSAYFLLFPSGFHFTA